MVCKHRGNTWFLGLSRVLITYNICPPGDRNSYALVFITSIIINQDQIWCVNIWANTSFLGPSWVLITYNICPPGNTTTIGKRSTDQPCLSFVRSSSGLFKCWLRWTESNTWLRWTESNDLPVSINRYKNMRVFFFRFCSFVSMCYRADAVKTKLTRTVLPKTAILPHTYGERRFVWGALRFRREGPQHSCPPPKCFRRTRLLDEWSTQNQPLYRWDIFCLRGQAPKLRN